MLTMNTAPSLDPEGGIFCLVSDNRAQDGSLRDFGFSGALCVLCFKEGRDALPWRAPASPSRLIGEANQGGPWKGLGWEPPRNTRLGDGGSQDKPPPLSECPSPTRGLQKSGVTSGHERVHTHPHTPEKGEKEASQHRC